MSINFGDCIYIAFDFSSSNPTGYFDPTSYSGFSSKLEGVPLNTSNYQKFSFVVAQSALNFGNGPLLYGQPFILIPAGANPTNYFYFDNSFQNDSLDDFSAIVNVPYSPTSTFPQLMIDTTDPTKLGTPVNYTDTLIIGVPSYNGSIFQGIVGYFILSSNNYFDVYGIVYYDNTDSKYQSNVYCHFYNMPDCTYPILPDPRVPTKCGRPSPYLYPYYGVNPLATTNPSLPFKTGNLNYGYANANLTSACYSGAECPSVGNNTYSKIPFQNINLSCANVGDATLNSTYGNDLYSPTCNMLGSPALTYTSDYLNSPASNYCYNYLDGGDYSNASISGWNLCQSNWTAQTTNLDNQVNCCAGIYTDSARCHPEYCPTGSTNTTTVDPCPGIMIVSPTNPGPSVCGSQVWGTNQNGYGTACDQYLSMTSPANAQALVLGAVTDYFNNNDVTSFTTNPFGKKVAGLCSLYPGTCDQLLSQVCAGQTKDSIDPINNNGDYTLLQTCGCFLPASEYSTLPNTTTPNVACDSVCRFPGTIPNNTNLTCDDTVCILSDVTVNMINSSAGAINFNTVCQSGASNTGSSSQCYFENVSVNNVNSTIAGTQFSTNCDSCYVINPSDPSNPQQVDCSTFNPLSSTRELFEYDPRTLTRKNKKRLGLGLAIWQIVLIFLFIILLIYIFYKYVVKKKR